MFRASMCSEDCDGLQKCRERRQSLLSAAPSVLRERRGLNRRVRVLLSHYTSWRVREGFPEEVGRELVTESWLYK